MPQTELNFNITELNLNIAELSFNTVTPLSEKRGVTFCQKNSLFTAEKMPRRDALVMLEEIPTP